ncbi:hypothetical protein Bbelb_236230 [Branchiostoma belcheri]|nr:hypothetical protein Bbelb_236230 [Branchiostoma belcheri]
MENTEGDSQDYLDPGEASQLVPFNPTQAVQQYGPCSHQACGAVALPYGPPPVYNVYNISNPVGLQIDSKGSSMTVDTKDVKEKAENPACRQNVGGTKEEVMCRKHDSSSEKNIVAAYYRDDLAAGQQSVLRVQELIFLTRDPVHHQARTKWLQQPFLNAEAHMLYLKSALFRKEKRYREAENAIVLARQGLDQMQVGRDTGEIWYNVAALFAQVLNDESAEIATGEFQATAAEAFHSAIEHYRKGEEEDGSCRNKLRRAHIRYAMSLLGCWSEVRPSNRGEDVTEEDLRQAGDSLDEVERSLWDGIPNRMRYYWHLARSDLFRYKNRTQRALEMAEEALKIAEASKFPSEVQFAEGRVKLLSKLVSAQRTVSDMKDSKSDRILEELFEDEDTFIMCNNNGNSCLVLIGVAVVFVALCVQYLLYYHHR